MNSTERQALRLAIDRARRERMQPLPLGKECRACGVALELATPGCRACGAARAKAARLSDRQHLRWTLRRD